MEAWDILENAYFSSATIFLPPPLILRLLATFGAITFLELDPASSVGFFFFNSYGGNE
jgi:hypothetical protein